MDVLHRLARPLVLPDTLLPPEAAKLAQLHYGDDRRPGISRGRRGKSFVYRDASGKPVHDAAALGRIKAIAVPPAWTEVWISADPLSHLQATGRDQRGRKQYRYHRRWRALRDANKYQHMLAFGRALPRIRRRVARDLALPGLPREKVLAAVERLMEYTLARVGNAEYARENHSFGLTTLRDRHARIRGGRIELDFRAKSGVRQHAVVTDAKLARILRNCRELPGSELFQYLDEAGQRHSIHSDDVNRYLRAVSGAEITAKDFRTWAGSILALLALARRPDGKPTRKAVVEVVKLVAKELGNTPAVCRKCYIHPELLEAYATGVLAPVLAELSGKRARPSLRSVEQTLMRFLKRRAARPRC